VEQWEKSYEGVDVKALVFGGAGQLTLETVDDPTPAPGEVVIRPDVVQVCATDVMNFERNPPYWSEDDGKRQRGGKWVAVMTEGMVPGHEGGGEVVAVGAGVTEYALGDRLVVDSIYRCGECQACREMRFVNCERMPAHSNRPGSPTYLGVNAADPSFGRGLMAEYCAVPVSMSYRVPDSVSAIASVAAEIGGVTLASVRTSGIQLGDTVVQIGGTLYGSHRMQLARLAGAGTIIYVESNPVRRAWAAKHGFADLIIDPAETDAAAVVRELHPRGVDLVFPSAVEPGSWGMAQRMVRQRGTVVPFDADPRLHLDFMDGFEAVAMTADGVTWTGHWPPIACAEPIKGGKDRNDHQLFMNLMAQGRIDGAAPITHVASMWGDIDGIRYAFTSPWSTEVRTAIQVSR
jgi:threonine dehydrogenase-like Zn-dependent dehydrogenase